MKLELEFYLESAAYFPSDGQIKLLNVTPIFFLSMSSNQFYCLSHIVGTYQYSKTIDKAIEIIL